MQHPIARAVRALTTLVLSAGLLSACGGSDAPTAPGVTTPPAGDPTPPPPVQVGALIVAITGLTAGASADVVVTGPNGFSRALSLTGVVVSLVPGRYTVAARAVRASDGRFAATSAEQSVDVAAGSTAATVTVAYAALPTQVDIEVAGLPQGVDGAVNVTSPSGELLLVTTTRRIAAAPAGRWRLAASIVRSGGYSYTPTPTFRDTTVLSGDTLRLPVQYAISSGAMAVAVLGLPIAVEPTVLVTGPNGFTRTIRGTTTLTDLAPGAYVVTSSTVSAAPYTYAPSATTQPVTVTASLVAAPVTLTFSAQIGRTTLTFSGLPNGIVPSFSITGSGFSRTVVGTNVGTVTVDSLPVGRYAVTPSPVSASGTTYATTPARRDIDVINAGTPVAASFVFAPVPVVVDVAIAGVPSGAIAAVTLTSPAGIDTALAVSTRIAGAAGRWHLAAAPTTVAGFIYTPTPTSRDTTLVSGDSARLSVQYALTSGAMAIAVTGLADGALAAVQIAGPGFFSRVVTATSTLTGLVPGLYTVTSNNVTVFGLPYVPATTSQQIAVSASLIASPVTVSYALAGGRLSLRAGGLPVGAVATFTLSGVGTPKTITGTTTVTGLTPGNYTLTANNVAFGNTTYVAAPASIPITITLALVSGATFVYAAAPDGGGGGGGGGFNLAIDNVYLTQATQRYDGTVSLVAGRDALLRAFVTASATNTQRPDVRVRIYDGATLLQTVTIPAPEASVRIATAEGTLASTWNTLIPAANVRTSLRVLVDVDPTSAITEADRTDNVWPRGSTPQTIAVASVPAFTVRFVPVVNGGLTGDVTEANKAAFLATARRIYPLQNVIADVRAPFTTSAPALQSNDGNSGWLTTLSELNALRTADGAPATTHYYGVVKVPYTSGIAGLGYVPGRAAMGWDYMPSGDGIAAHEWGHNFARDHTPCGVSGDPQYPYPGGVIGVWGWNSSTNALVSPSATDIMSYCSNQWISDWTWSQVLQYRQGSGSVAQADVRGEGLLIWGRVVDGTVLLEPAFRVNARRSATPVSASHRVELLDREGQSLLDIPMMAERVPDVVDHDERQFAIVVPWSARLERSLTRVRVRDARSQLASATRTVSAAAVVGTSADPASSTSADSRGRTRLRWNAQAYPMVMARDAVTGDILGFLRAPGDVFSAHGRAVELVYSDGVRSLVHRQ